MDSNPKSYKFIKETIKKDPPDRKKWIIRSVLFVCAAVGFGLIAAVTFAIAEPKISAAVHGTGKVDIPTDEEPEPDADPDPESGAAASATPTPSPTPTTEPEREITLEDYQNLYSEMLSVAEKPQRSLATVIGITNQMDYFNQNYENQQQITGLVVAEKGADLFILTEYRIVENVERIQVTFWDSSTVDAIYQRHDANTGLTVLKVEAAQLSQSTRDGLEIAPLGNSYGVSQGDPVLALGSPMGYSDSVAYGVVTSVTNKISTLDTEYTLLTTDILGSPDGSGILINLEGEIVGIIAQNYSSDSKNIVTGLAISQIKSLIESLSNDEARPYIGIKGQDVTEELSEQTGIPKGVLVNSVAENSPAMFSGMMEYDVIVKIGEEKVQTVKQYQEQLGECSPGETIRITAMRKGAEGYAEMEFDVTVGEI